MCATCVARVSWQAKKKAATKPQDGASAPAKPAAPKEPRPVEKSQQRTAQRPSEAVTADIDGTVIRFTLPIPAGTTALELMDMLRAVPSTAVVW